MGCQVRQSFDGTARGRLRPAFQDRPASCERANAGLSQRRASRLHSWLDSAVSDPVSLPARDGAPQLIDRRKHMANEGFVSRLSLFVFVALTVSPLVVAQWSSSTPPPAQQRQTPAVEKNLE